MITWVAGAGFADKQNSTQYQLLPLLGTRTGYGHAAEARYLYTFLGIGLAILVLALINYMNLATARATQQAKEVGVRKTMGPAGPSWLPSSTGSRCSHAYWRSGCRSRWCSCSGRRSTGCWACT